MAFRRKFFRKRPFRRRNAYDMQRGLICDGIMFVGSGNCESSTTDMVSLVEGGQTLDTTSLGRSLFGLQTPPIVKGVVFGGMRFWLDWSLDCNQTAIQEATLASPGNIWSLHLLWFVAKIPLDPNSGLPVYVPDLWDPTGSGGFGTRPMNAGDLQYELLWTRQELVNCAGNNQGGVHHIVGTFGGVGQIDVGLGTAFPGGHWPQKMHPHRIKTKRRLNELEALFFGVCSHSSGLAVSANRFDYELKVDLYAQAALKTMR